MIVLKKEEGIKLGKEEKAAAIENIKSYLSEHFDIELSGFQAGLFVDFLSEHIAKYYYNQAVADCMEFVGKKTEDMYILMKD